MRRSGGYIISEDRYNYFMRRGLNANEVIACEISEHPSSVYIDDISTYGPGLLRIEYHIRGRLEEMECRCNPPMMVGPGGINFADELVDLRDCFVPIPEWRGGPMPGPPSPEQYGRSPFAGLSEKVAKYYETMAGLKNVIPPVPTPKTPLEELRGDVDEWLSDALTC